jgi:protein O-GlcNAc transferase
MPIGADRKSPFDEALALHQAGALEEAARGYLRILQRAPRDFNSLHLLGVLRLSQGKPGEAVRLIRQALAIDGGFADAHVNLGNALAGLKQFDQAVASFGQALKLNANLPQAHYNLGNALKATGRIEAAIAAYRQAVRLAPTYVEAHYNLGNALKEHQGLDEAVACYDRVLALKPAHAEAWLNRGDALRRMRRTEEALASYRQVLAIDPGSHSALNNLGNVLAELKRFEPAIAASRQALSLVPHSAETLVNLAACLRGAARPEEAAASCRAALAAAPDAADAHYTLGLIEQDLGRSDEALACFTRALELAPAHRDALSQALAVADANCAWDAVAVLERRLDAHLADGDLAIGPFYFLNRNYGAREQLICAQSYRKNKIFPSESIVTNIKNDHHDKIRVAYLSADFHSHATSYLINELFELHDKSKFDIIAISFGPDSEDEFRKKLVGSVTRFIDVQHQGDFDVARLLKELEIDIAVDLKGYTRDSRPGILAFRPAPIQVNYLGFPGTMGADYMDYIIADRVIIPPAERAFYTENIVYLPDSYQPNDSRRRIGEHTPIRAEVGLPETGFVFCSFNNSYKIVPAVFDSWMRLLHRVAGSVLWLLESNAAVVRNLQHSAENRGIAPDRLIFAPRIGLEDHLARHRLADLMLDSLPINAHTTASDALWAGLPVVTCAGSTFAGRVAGSLLMAIGLPELITQSLEEYEALALALALDSGRLAALKSKLAQNRRISALFDTDRYRRHLESAYETMHARYQKGEPPAEFAVPPLAR